MIVMNISNDLRQFLQWYGECGCGKTYRAFDGIIIASGYRSR